MQVKLRFPAFGPEFSHQAGDVVDLDDASAESLLKNGDAELPTETPAATPEVPAAPAAEVPAPAPAAAPVAPAAPAAPVAKPAAKIAPQAPAK